MPYRPQHFFGFASIADFLCSLTSPNWGHIHTAVVLFFAGVTSFITGWVWESPEAIYTLWSLMALDYGTGIIKSFLAGTFVSFKLWRMPIYFVATTLILSLAFWMSASTVVFALLPTIVISGFMSVYFISILENMGEIGVLPKAMVTLLKSKFGMKALIEKYDKMKDND